MENNKDILKQIISGDAEEIAKAVQMIQESGDLSIAEVLLQNLGEVQDVHTQTIITNLLADVKDSHFRDILLRYIENETNTGLKREMLHIVWESSLDYSAHWRLFVEMLKDDDFAIAFEASTVIENFVHNLSDEDKKALYEDLLLLPDSKQVLYINVLEELNH